MFCCSVLSETFPSSSWARALLRIWLPSWGMERGSRPTLSCVEGLEARLVHAFCGSPGQVTIGKDWCVCSFPHQDSQAWAGPRHQGCYLGLGSPCLPASRMLWCWLHAGARLSCLFAVYWCSSVLAAPVAMQQPKVPRQWAPPTVCASALLSVPLSAQSCCRVGMEGPGAASWVNFNWILLATPSLMICTLATLNRAKMGWEWLMAGYLVASWDFECHLDVLQTWLFVAVGTSPRNTVTAANCHALLLLTMCLYSLKREGSISSILQKWNLREVK